MLAGQGPDEIVIRAFTPPTGRSAHWERGAAATSGRPRRASTIHLATLQAAAKSTAQIMLVRPRYEVAIGIQTSLSFSTARVDALQPVGPRPSPP